MPWLFFFLLPSKVPLSSACLPLTKPAGGQLTPEPLEVSPLLLTAELGVGGRMCVCVNQGSEDKQLSTSIFTCNWD